MQQYESTSCEVWLMRERQVALFSHLRSRHLLKSDDSLTDLLNERLAPHKETISRETVRRWASGRQLIGKRKRKTLALALGCTKEALDQYLADTIPENLFFGKLDQQEESTNDKEARERFAQTIENLKQLPLSLIAQVIARASDIFAEQWNKIEAAQQIEPHDQEVGTIARSVNLHWDELVPIFESGASLSRLQAIRDGIKPNQEELELLSVRLPQSLEELEIICEKEFRTNGTGCSADSR